MLLKKIQVHPFDLDESLINGNLILDKKERDVHPKFQDMLERMQRQNPQTILTDLYKAIKKRLGDKNMLPRQWEDFRNQFDENDERSKKTFNDLLSMLQRESFYRDTLAEALIFKQSSVRLSFKLNVQFMASSQQQNIQNDMSALMLNTESQDQTVQPSFSYLIVELRMFHFMGTMMLLMTNDQGTCQLYDAETGVLQHNFVFYQSFTSKQRQPAKVAQSAFRDDDESEPTEVDAQAKDDEPEDHLAQTHRLTSQMSAILSREQGGDEIKRFRAKTIADPKAFNTVAEDGNVSKIDVIEEDGAEENFDEGKPKKGKKFNNSQTLMLNEKGNSAAESLTLTRGGEQKTARNSIAKFKTQITVEPQKLRKSVAPLPRPRTNAGKFGRNYSSFDKHKLEFVATRKSAMETTREIERVPLRTRPLDERRRKMREFDEKSKMQIEEHLRLQRQCQKLGLDYIMYEDKTPRGSKQQRKPNAKASVSTRSLTSGNDMKRSKMLRTAPTVDSSKNKTLGGESSPNKKQDNNLSPFKMGAAWAVPVQQVEKYRARKEDIPFDMHEKAWDLDSCRDNFDKFQSYFSTTVERKWHEDQVRLKKVHEQNKEKDEWRRRQAQNQDANDDSRHGVQLEESRFSKSQEMRASLKRGSQRAEAFVQDRKKFGSQATNDGQLGVNGRAGRNVRLNYSSQQVKGENDRKLAAEKQIALKKAYKPLLERGEGDLISNMDPMTRFKREMFLLHEHDDALEVIVKGIRGDQQRIAQNLHNNQLLNRVLEKQRDRNQKWIMAFADEERKDAAEQRLPSIEPINFDRYEETQEEKKQDKYKFQQIYEAQDVSLKQLMDQHMNRKEKELTPRTRQKAQQKMKPSRPMFMAHYSKDDNELVIFALLKEIKVIEMKQNGQKKTFNPVCSYGLLHLPVAMDVGTDKITGNLLIIVACQRFRKNKTQKKGKEQSEEQNRIYIIEVDVKNGTCKKKHSFTPDKPQITKLIYDENYGLIMACYRGYIERFDNINFKSVQKWDNNLKAVGSEKNKNGPKAFGQSQNENSHNDQQKFDNWICDELKKRKIIAGGPGDEEMNDRADGSQMTFQENSQSRSKQIDNQLDQPLQKKGTPAVCIARRLADVRANALKALKQEKNEKQQIQTINCLDYSADLYLIAFGGVHGKIGVLDSTTMHFIGLFDAHANLEVSAIYFYKKEKQMISVSQEGDCALWDAQKMTILQMVRNRDLMNKTKNISTTGFDQLSGTLLLATSDVLRFELKEDSETKIQIDQQLTVAANYLQQMKAAVDQAGTFKGQLPQDEDRSDKEEEDDLKSRVKSKMENNMKIVGDILNYKKLPQMQALDKAKGPKSFDIGSHTVLPSRRTKLIGCFINVKAGRMFTIDIDCLIRQWDLLTGKCVRSYPLEQPTAANEQNSGTNNLSNFKHRNQIQTVKLDSDMAVIVVAFQNGYIQLNNIYSGTVLYNKAAENMLDLGREISDLAFFHKQTNFWVAATLWEGQVAFLQRPLKDKGSEIIREKKVDSRHGRDVISIDICHTNHMATASLDHSIIFWNTYSGKEGKIIYMPEELVAGTCIQSIRFALRDNHDFLFVFMQHGNMYILETQSETFIEPSDFESNKIINPYSFGRIPKFAIIDLKQKEDDSGIEGAQQLYIIAVEESGKEGSMYEITMSEPKHMVEADRKAGVPKHVQQRRLTHKKSFSISDVNKLFYLPKCNKVSNPNASVIKVELLPEMNFFIVCHSNGVIGFFDICSGDLISYFNEPNYSPNLYNLFSYKYNETIREKRKTNKENLKIENFTDTESDEEAKGDNINMPISSRQPYSTSSRIYNRGAVNNRIGSAEKKSGGPPALMSANDNSRAPMLTSKHAAGKNFTSPGDLSKRQNLHNVQSSDGNELKQGSTTRNAKQMGATARTKTTQAMTSPNFHSP